MKEIWKPVCRYEGRYEISNLGRVRSNVQKRPRFMRLERAKKGYLSVALSKAGVVRRESVHTLVLEAFDKPRPPGLQCAHLDGNPANNLPNNLKWVTCKENHAHLKIHGTDNAGERHPMRKLDAKQVREIRALAESGLLPVEIEKRFPVSLSTICRIIKRVNWRHL